MVIPSGFSANHAADLRHYAKRSNHHAKDEQQLFVVSVVAYDSLLGHHTGVRLCSPPPAGVRFLK
jgi:hypothetical protein